MPADMISVIVPCFNEAPVIRETWKRIRTVLTSLPDYTHEILFVNDGSADQTLEILKEIAAIDPNVRILSFSRNFGHEAATTAGLHHCRGTLAFLLDADLQDPPELLTEMLATMKETGCDAVYGVRKQRLGESRLKRWTATVFYRILNWMTEVPIPADTGDFRLINRNIISSFCTLTERPRFVRGLLAWSGFRQVPYPYVRAPRAAGKTKYNYWRLLKLAVNVITAFSRKPLIAAIWAGAAAAVFSMMLLLLTSTGTQIPFISSPTTMAALLLLFVAIQLLSIGIIGIYVYELLQEQRNRPHYIIAEEIQFRSLSSRRTSQPMKEQTGSPSQIRRPGVG